MFTKSLCLVATLTLFAAPTKAQVVTFGGDSDRKISNVMFFDQGARKYLGGYAVNYGSATWKDEYNKHVGAAGESVLRLGSGDWATFDTSVPMTIGGVKVGAGQWYLALGSQDGKLFLVMMRAGYCRKNKVPSFRPQLAKQKKMIPFKHATGESNTEKLSISVAADKKNVANGTLTLKWGKHVLTAPIVANYKVPGATDAAGKKRKKKAGAIK